MRLIFVLIALLLVACSPATVAEPTPTVAPTPTPAEPTPAALTGQQVIDAFVAAGLEISDVRIGERAEGSLLPNTYDENLEFTVAEVAPKGGQIFICRAKEYCDALMGHFDTYKNFGGPYFYQSPGDLVVAQLNKGLSVDTAEKFKAVIEALP